MWGVCLFFGGFFFFFFFFFFLKKRGFENAFGTVLLEVCNIGEFMLEVRSSSSGFCRCLYVSVGTDVFLAASLVGFMRYCAALGASYEQPSTCNMRRIYTVVVQAYVVDMLQSWTPDTSSLAFATPAGYIVGLNVYQPREDYSQPPQFDELKAALYPLEHG